MTDDDTQQPPDAVRAYLAEIGAKGGNANTPAQIEAREKQRAARRKLSPEQRAAVAERVGENAKALAAEYGVSSALIWKIWRDARLAQQAQQAIEEREAENDA